MQRLSFEHFNSQLGLVFTLCGRYENAHRRDQDQVLLHIFLWTLASSILRKTARTSNESATAQGLSWGEDHAGGCLENLTTDASLTGALHVEVPEDLTVSLPMEYRCDVAEYAIHELVSR
jgi:hypothetical protein